MTPCPRAPVPRAPAPCALCARRHHRPRIPCSYLVLTLFLPSSYLVLTREGAFAPSLAIHIAYRQNRQNRQNHIAFAPVGNNIVIIHPRRPEMPLASSLPRGTRRSLSTWRRSSLRSGRTGGCCRICRIGTTVNVNSPAGQNISLINSRCP
jgi:hypothetical protein